MAKLNPKQVDKKEKIVKAMKRSTDEFKDRYGKDAKSVMYATATKLAKNESVEFSVQFNESLSAHEFANALKQYNITSYDSIHTQRDGSASVVFETKIDNDEFINWLSSKHDSLGVSLCFEDILPPTPNHITGGSAMTFSSFTAEAHAVDYDMLFAEEKINEADDAYKKTRAYKKMSPDKKKAVDYFMDEIESMGINSIERITKDTVTRYNISTSELNDFLENIFFAEDIAYIRSLSEAEQKEDPIKKKVESDRDKKSEENKKADEKKKDEKKADTEKKKTEKSADAAKAPAAGDDKEGEGKEQAPTTATKTFQNFKSDLKPSESGKSSVTNPEDNEKKMKLEKPVKGSPVKDAELKDELDEAINTDWLSRFKKKPSWQKEIQKMSDDDLLKTAEDENRKGMYDLWDMMPEISKRAKKNRKFADRANDSLKISKMADATGLELGKDVVKLSTQTWTDADVERGSYKSGLFKK